LATSAAFGLILVLATAIAGEAIHLGELSRRETVVQRFNTRHTTAGGFIEAYVRQIESQQISLAKLALTGPVSSSRFNEIRKLSLLTAAALYDGDGNLLRASPAARRSAPLTPQEDAALQSALGAISAVTAVSGADAQNNQMIAFAVPITTPTGPRVFTGRYAVEDTLLRSFVVNSLSTYRIPHVYLVSADGTVIAADRRDDSGLPLAQAAPALAGAIVHHSQGFLTGRRQYYVSGPITGTGWQLVFTLDSAELWAAQDRSQQDILWTALGAFFVMGVALIALFDRALVGRARAEDEHARREAILDSAWDAFIGIDDRATVTDWNLAAGRLLGWTKPEAVGQPIVSLCVEASEQGDFARRILAFLHGDGGADSRQVDVLPMRHRDGRTIPVELTVVRARWDGQRRVHAFLRDITERLQHERQMRDLALTDPLTGLANRRAFLEQLDQAHARATRHGRALAVLYADVDHFKAINDTYGHGAGDTVLRQVADRLRSQFRAEDTVGRLGGDEFAVICPDLNTDEPDLVGRLLEALAVPYLHRGHQIAASVSIGVAVRRDDESAIHLLERADERMYRAKAAR
jgi:diguanylate cyclase (GGDEF)-like protein/PAS domain S-box-containing protein